MSANQTSYGSWNEQSIGHGETHSPDISSLGAFDSLEALSDALKAKIDADLEAYGTGAAAVELSLSPETVLPLFRPKVGPYAEGGKHDLPLEFKSTTTNEEGDVILDPFPKVTVASTVNVLETAKRHVVQRAASRAILKAIETVDGYGYYMNNVWAAKEGEGFRFSYYCQDSMQNKERRENAVARAEERLRSKGELVGPRKAVFDCKGSIAVKFSMERQSIDVFYRHSLLHATVTARQHLPRLRRRRVPLEGAEESQNADGSIIALDREDDSGLIMQAENGESPSAEQPQSSKAVRSLKRKRRTLSFPSVRPMPRSQHEQPPSLLDLLERSQAANFTPRPSKIPNHMLSTSATTVVYDMPSWQWPSPYPLYRTVSNQIYDQIRPSPSNQATLARPQLSSTNARMQQQGPSPHSFAPNGYFTQR